MSARRVKVNDSKPLSAAQDAARKRLGLEFAVDYRWYRVIEKTGTEGAQWGCLAAAPFQRLQAKGLIARLGPVVWTRDNYLAAIEGVQDGTAGGSHE